MIVKTTWTKLKPRITTNSLAIQYIEQADGNYFVFIVESSLIISCLIFNSDPANEDQIDFETNFKTNANKSLLVQPSPFASKSLTCGKKIFKRYHGGQYAVNAGSNTILYTISYDQVKITGLDIMYAEPLDTVDLLILDSTTGTYSTIPNYVLNQFGFGVNISKDFFRYENNYDADLYINMQIKVVYNSQSAKTIGINFNLSEVK